MNGRALAIWYRLADPDEARRHIPGMLQADADPVVRVRFWDLIHDGSPGSRDGGHPGGTAFREAVVAFPVKYGTIVGDYPTYMYADDFGYIAFGRETMGWPVRHGTIRIGRPPGDRLLPEAVIVADLERQGQLLMRASLKLTGRQVSVDDSVLPRWLALKVIPDVASARAAVGQLVSTGPSRFARAEVWEATATMELHEGAADELHFLAPRQVIAAQYWIGVELTIDDGRVLAEFGDQVWTVV